MTTAYDTAATGRSGPTGRLSGRSVAGVAVVFGLLLALGWRLPDLVDDPAEPAMGALPAAAAVGPPSTLRPPGEWEAVRGAWDADGATVELAPATVADLLVQEADGAVRGIAARAEPVVDGWGLVVGRAEDGSHLRATLHPLQRLIRLEQVGRRRITPLATVPWTRPVESLLAVLELGPDGVVLKIDGQVVLQAPVPDIGSGVGLTYTGGSLPTVSWRQVALVPA